MMQFREWLLLLCLAFGPCTNAATYYLDSSGGSNANNGLSPATAWKDMFKIRALPPQPGDVFLFKRGEVWEDLQLYITHSGTQAAPVTYGAYGSGELPVIDVLTTLSGTDNQSNWSQPGPNVWTFNILNSPGRLFFDGAEQLRASTLPDLGQADNEGAVGRWFFDAGTLYVFASQNPAALFSSIEGSVLFNAALIEGANHLNIENIAFRGGRGASLSVRGGSNIQITGCELGQNANSGLTLIDLSGIASSYVTVANNVFDAHFTFFYGNGSERGCGDGVKLFDGVNNCQVHNNVFKNWAHNAVELLGDASASSGVYDNKIYENDISAPDIPYAHPLGVDGLIGKCQFNEFYRNYITDCRTASQVNGNDNWVHHNIIVGMRRSPSKTQATAHAFSIGIYGSGLVSQDNRFDHNLIIDTDEAAFLIRGYGLPGQAAGHSIRNNIIYRTGLAPYNSAYRAGTGLVIFDTNTDGVGPNTYQNNLYFGSSGASFVYLQDQNQYLSSSAFNAQDGSDGNTISGNLDGDPIFTSLAARDYTPRDDSPAVNAGTDTGLALDYNLDPRFVGRAPDIGPFENATVLPLIWMSFTVEPFGESDLSIDWSTESEIDVSSFEIQRRSSMTEWRPIHRMSASGHPEGRTNYHFIDEDPGKGTFYYRIKQTDMDGTFTYSDIRSYTLAQALTFSIVKLSADEFKLVLSESVDESRLSFEVYSVGGRRLSVPIRNRVIDLGKLPSGVYLLRANLSGIPFKTLSMVK